MKHPLQKSIRTETSALMSEREPSPDLLLKQEGLQIHKKDRSINVLERAEVKVKWEGAMAAPSVYMNITLPINPPGANLGHLTHPSDGVSPVFQPDDMH